MTYFNTTREIGTTLATYRGKALTQNELIMRWFLELKRLNPSIDSHVSPHELCEMLFDDEVPITSVRRALTTLTNEGKLEKTSRQREGRYGRMEHCWRLNEPRQGRLL